MAPNIVVADGFVVRLNAVDASTGNTVSGVKVSNVIITAEDLHGEQDAGQLADVAPLWVPLPEQAA